MLNNRNKFKNNNQMILSLIILAQENIKNIYQIKFTIKVKRKKKKFHNIVEVSYLLKRMERRIFLKK